MTRERVPVPDSVDHRAVILGSIRRSLGAPAPTAGIAAEYAAIPRIYLQSSNLDQHAVSELFADRLREYDAGVYHACDSSISTVVAEILRARGKTGLAIPAGVAENWLPQGFAFEVADLYDAFELDRAQGVLTGCTVAIAETGSIVLQNAKAQGPRILSLVPDYHLCVVFEEQIVAKVPEAFERIEATSALPTTFISGPSATADIEMTRIKGVHGPRFLDVVLVAD
jgi:L-lactate dehydrogenase complex protein LldG